MPVGEVRSTPSPYEAKLPHGENLFHVYAGVGAAAFRLAETNDIAQKALGESLLADTRVMMPGSRVYRAVEAAFSMPHSHESYSAQFDAGVELGEAIVASTDDPRQRVVTFLNAYFQVIKARIGTQGTANLDSYINSISDFSRAVVVTSLPTDEDSLEMLVGLEQEVKELADRDDMFGFFTLPMLAICQETLYRSVASHVFKSEVDPNAPQPSAEEVASTIDMAQEIIASKRYEVKPAYTEASTGGSWLYYDGPSFFIPRQDKTFKIDVPAAFILHSDKTSFQTTKLRLLNTTQGKQSGLITKETAAEIVPNFMLYLQPNGSLTLDDLGLRELRAELKDDRAYLRALAEITAGYFDLTRSASQVRASGVRNFSQLTSDERADYDPVVDLLLPRSRALRNSAGATKAEQQEDDKEEAEANRRTIRKHEVIAHPRMLPPGYTPNPEALALAETLGIKLEPGETLVKKHNRGSGNEVEGHKVVS